MGFTRLDHLSVGWNGPSWCNETFSEDNGFQFRDWNLREALSSAGAEARPLKMLLNYGMPDDYARRVLPREYLGACMQFRRDQATYQPFAFREHSFPVDWLNDLNHQVYRTTGMSLYARRELVEALMSLGCTSTADVPSIAQIAYTLKFENHEYQTQLSAWYPSAYSLAYVLASMHFKDDNPKVVYWYDDPGLLSKIQGDLRDMKPKSARWPKFLQMLNRKFGFNFSDDDIQKFATWVGETLKVPKYQFRLVSGDNISYYYNQAHFGSCMHEAEATAFYDMQPKNVVQMLVIEDEYRKYVGRALVWDGTYRSGNPVRFMDRVYPSDGGRHIAAAMKYSKEQGWEYKVRHSIGGELSTDKKIVVRVKDVDFYPYMDTLQNCSAPEGGYFELSNKHNATHCYALDSTDNCCPWEDDADEDYYCCDHCGDRVYMYDVTHINDMVYCEYCRDQQYGWDDTNDEWVSLDQLVELANIGSSFMRINSEDHRVVYSEVDDVYYWIGGRIYSYSVTEAVCLTYGTYEGEYTIHYVVVDAADGETYSVHAEDTEVLDALKEEGGEW